MYLGGALEQAGVASAAEATLQSAWPALLKCFETAFAAPEEAAAASLGFRALQVRLLLTIACLLLKITCLLLKKTCLLTGFRALQTRAVKCLLELLPRASAEQRAQLGAASGGRAWGQLLALCSAAAPTPLGVGVEALVGKCYSLYHDLPPAAAKGEVEQGVEQGVAAPLLAREPATNTNDAAFAQFEFAVATWRARQVQVAPKSDKNEMRRLATTAGVYAVDDTAEKDGKALQGSQAESSAAAAGRTSTEEDAKAGRALTVRCADGELYLPLLERTAAGGDLMPSDWKSFSDEELQHWQNEQATAMAVSYGGLASSLSLSDEHLCEFPSLRAEHLRWVVAWVRQKAVEGTLAHGMRLQGLEIQGTEIKLKVAQLLDPDHADYKACSDEKQRNAHHAVLGEEQAALQVQLDEARGGWERLFGRAFDGNKVRVDDAAAAHVALAARCYSCSSCCSR